MEDIDLPQIGIGISHPEFRLPGIAALDPILPLRPKTGALQPGLELDQLFGIHDPKPQMVERAAVSIGNGFERQHQWRLLQLELCVIGMMFQRRSSKEGLVKSNGPFQVGHIQADMELYRLADAAHGWSFLAGYRRRDPSNILLTVG